MILRWFHLSVIGGIIFAGVLLYGYTLPFPFVFDDLVYLVDNPLVKEGRSFAFLSDFTNFATFSQRAGLDPDLSTNFILRPITYFTFFLNYVVGGMQPRWFRAVNVLIHCANAVLIFQFLWLLLRTSRKAVALQVFSAGFIAASAAFLFLVHPLQTESVTYIVQRFTSLGTFFYLLTLWAYFLAKASDDKQLAWLWRCTSFASLVLGMLSKEIVFTAPFMLVILDCLILGTPFKRACRSAWPYFLCLPILPVLIGLTSWAQHGGQLSFFGALNVANAVDSPQNPYHYTLTQLSVVLSYLRLIILPWGLNLDRQYPLSLSLLDGRVLVSMLLIAGLVAGAGLWFRRHSNEVRGSLLFAGVLWYFVTLAMDSSVIPLPDVMADHRSYLPSIGALTALACCIDLLRTRWNKQRRGQYVSVVAVASWVLMLSVATVARNQVWRSELDLWRDTAMKSPEKFRPWSNLGVAAFNQGKLQEAIGALQKAIQLEPTFVVGYVNLGTMENSMGRYREALETSQRGLKYAPRDFNLYYNRGVSFYELGQYDLAIRSFEQAIAIQAGDHRPHYALGELHARLQHYDDALKYFKRAASLQPDNPRLRQTIRQVESMAQRRSSTP